MTKDVIGYHFGNFSLVLKKLLDYMVTRDHSYFPKKMPKSSLLDVK